MKERIIISTDPADRGKWNAAANHPMQTWEWGEARASLGTQVVRIARAEEDLFTQVFQMTVHPIPHTPFGLGYLPRSAMPDDAMLAFLKEYATAHKLLFVKIEPYCPPLSTAPDLLRPSPHPLFPSWSQTLDLIPTEDSLLKNMKPKTRYNIRLAEKKGVIVREENTEDGFSTFADLYFDTCRRQRYFGHTRTYHHTIWKSLKDTMAHILIARVGDDPVAAYELFYHNKTLYYPYGGTSEKHRNLMGANLIMWEAIRLGRKLGATSFDMWGSLPKEYPPDHPWTGFTRFKEGYGTTFAEFAGSYDLVAHPNLYSAYNLAYRLRETYLSIRKSL
jgi:lipid II:glycine glycyltransferase (peptidoglycan interpeptide bridge formation enzyme)